MTTYAVNTEGTASCEESVQDLHDQINQLQLDLFQAGFREQLILEDRGILEGLLMDIADYLESPGRPVDAHERYLDLIRQMARFGEVAGNRRAAIRLIADLVL